MKKSRFTEAQNVAVLHEWDAGAKTADLVRRHGVTEQTLYRWKKKYGGMQISEAKRLKALQFFEAVQFRDANPVVLLLPQVERPPTDLVLPWQVGHRGAGFGFVEDPDNLGFSELRLPHQVLRWGPPKSNFQLSRWRGSLRRQRP